MARDVQTFTADDGGKGERERQRERERRGLWVSMGEGRWGG